MCPKVVRVGVLSSKLESPSGRGFSSAKTRRVGVDIATIFGRLGLLGWPVPCSAETASRAAQRLDFLATWSCLHAGFLWFRLTVRLGYCVPA